MKPTVYFVSHTDSTYGLAEKAAAFLTFYDYEGMYLACPHSMSAAWQPTGVPGPQTCAYAVPVSPQSTYSLLPFLYPDMYMACFLRKSLG